MKLDFSYNNRESEDTYLDLGLAIFNLCQFIPNGVLIVFSSTTLMEKCKNIWYKVINKLKGTPINFK